MKEFFARHPKVVKALLLGYVVFAGCFSFPISSERFPLDPMKTYLLLANIGIFGFSFAELEGAKQGKKVYVQLLLFTAIGLVCRYFLEFGEVSNTYNFTSFNIAAYLALIPLLSLVVYSRFARNKEENE